MDGRASSRGPRLLNRLARLVTLEGGEGAGKSTQLQALTAALRAQAQTVVTTREPGGSAGAEAIRRLLVEGAANRWSATSELFLFMAARRDHLERTIRPALAQGAWVLCDRYWDSTRVYQGAVGGLGLAEVDALHTTWLGDFKPGLTLLFDLAAEAGLARAAGGRFEAKGAAFHARVRQAFLALAAAEPERFRVVDAAGTAAEVTAAALVHLETYARAEAAS